MTQLRVRFLGPFAMPTGYARAMHDYLMALRTRAVVHTSHQAEETQIEVVPILDCDSDNLEPRYADLANHVGIGIDPNVVIVHTVPRFAHEFVTGDMEPPPGVKKVALTTWETDRMGADDVENLMKHFDAIVVPSEYNMDAIFNGGSGPSFAAHKVHVVPHAYDPVLWRSPPADLGRYRSPHYTFYSIGVWSERKNPIGLLKAYYHAFAGNHDVLLRMVCPAVNMEDVAALARCFGRDDLPAVEFLGVGDERLTEDQLIAVHHDSDCFVTTTRGEGWGLGAFEAAIVGNPVIAPEGGGHLDFLRYYHSYYPVKFQWTPAITPEVKQQLPIIVGDLVIQPISVIQPTGICGDQLWMEPDLAGIAGSMIECYESRAIGKKKPAEFSAQFSYAAVGAQFDELLQTLVET